MHKIMSVACWIPATWHDITPSIWKTKSQIQLITWLDAHKSNCSLSDSKAHEVCILYKKNSDSLLIKSIQKRSLSCLSGWLSKLSVQNASSPIPVCALICHPSPLLSCLLCRHWSLAGEIKLTCQAWTFPRIPTLPGTLSLQISGSLLILLHLCSNATS